MMLIKKGLILRYTPPLPSRIEKQDQKSQITYLWLCISKKIQKIQRLYTVPLNNESFAFFMPNMNSLRNFDLKNILYTL